MVEKKEYKYLKVKVEAFIQLKNEVELLKKQMQEVKLLLMTNKSSRYQLYFPDEK